MLALFLLSLILNPIFPSISMGHVEASDKKIGSSLYSETFSGGSADMSEAGVQLGSGGISPRISVYAQSQLDPSALAWPSGYVTVAVQDPVIWAIDKDMDGPSGIADFFVEVLLGGNVYNSKEHPGTQWNCEHVYLPGWMVVGSFEPGLEPVIIFIQVLDYDTYGGDDHCDVNSRPGEKIIKIAVDLNTGQWSGVECDLEVVDSSVDRYGNGYYVLRSEGGGDNYRAGITFWLVICETFLFSAGGGGGGSGRAPKYYSQFSKFIYLSEGMREEAKRVWEEYYRRMEDERLRATKNIVIVSVTFAVAAFLTAGVAPFILHAVDVGLATYEAHETLEVYDEILKDLDPQGFEDLADDCIDLWKEDGYINELSSYQFPLYPTPYVPIQNPLSKFRERIRPLIYLAWNEADGYTRRDLGSLFNTLEKEESELKELERATDSIVSILENWNWYEQHYPVRELQLENSERAIRYSLREAKILQGSIKKDLEYVKWLRERIGEERVGFSVTSISLPFMTDLPATVDLTFEYTATKDGKVVRAETVTIKGGQVWTSELFWPGTKLDFKVEPATIRVDGAEYVFKYWSEYPPIELSEQPRLVASYQTRYSLAVNSDPPGIDLTGLGVVRGVGMYDACTYAYLESDASFFIGQTMYVFAGWSGDAWGTETKSKPIYMNQPKTAIAKYAIKYALTVKTKGLVLTIESWNPTEEQWEYKTIRATTNVYIDGSKVASGISNDFAFTNFYDKGTVLTNVNIDTPTFPPELGWRFIFTHWSDAVAGSTLPIASITMDSPKTITANYKPQCLIYFTTSGLPNGISMTFTINGATHGVTTPTPYGEWVDHQSSITFSIDPQSFTHAGHNFQLVRWDRAVAPGPPTGFIAFPDTYIAVYNSTAATYTVIVNVIRSSPLYVNNAFLGFGSRAFMFLDGTTNNITVDRYVPSGLGTRYHCTSNSLNVSSAQTITFTYHIEYLLKVKTEGLPPSVGSTGVRIGGSSAMDGYGTSTINDGFEDGWRKWYDANLATGTIDIDSPINGFSFTAWTVNDVSRGSTRPLSSLTMDRPYTMVANYAHTPDFRLSASPNSQTTIQSGSVSYVVNSTSMFGFNSSISLSLIGLPGDASYKFNPTSIVPNSSSTLTVTVGPTTGNFTLTVTGTWRMLNHSHLATLIIDHAPDFNISVCPAHAILMLGDMRSYTVTVTSIGNFNSTVSLTVSDVPTGMNASIIPAKVTPRSGGVAYSTLTLSVSPLATPGNYTLTVFGSSGTSRHLFQISLTTTTLPKLRPPTWIGFLPLETEEEYLPLKGEDWLKLRPIPILIMLIAIAIILIILVVIIRRKRKRKAIVPPAVPKAPPVPEAKHCIHCGAEMPVDAVYCVTCGREQ